MVHVVVMVLVLESRAQYVWAKGEMVVAHKSKVKVYVCLTVTEAHRICLAVLVVPLVAEMVGLDLR